RRVGGGCGGEGPGSSRRQRISGSILYAGRHGCGIFRRKGKRRGWREGRFEGAVVGDRRSDRRGGPLLFQEESLGTDGGRIDRFRKGNRDRRGNGSRWRALGRIDRIDR